ncbi:MAG: hypothetical protein NXI27_25995 [Alphaproteobacteria bacterium]|nr:hypothetical protein [Alphaproteobacteria bacterium]
MANQSYWKSGTMQVAISMAPGIYKTVDRTSTIQRAIIMNTKIRKQYAADVTIANDVFNISPDRLPRGLTMSAISWEFPGPHELENDAKVIGTILQTVFGATEPRDVWMCFGEAVWNPESRIAKHITLWGYLKRGGVEFPDTNQKIDRLVSVNGEKGVYAAVQIKAFEADHRLWTKRWGINDHFAIVPAGGDISSLIDQGWEFEDIVGYGAYDFLVKHSGIILRKYGEMGSHDHGMLAVGRQEEIRAVFG